MRLMGVPTSEVGYTPAMPRRENHEVHKDMWGHWTKKKTIIQTLYDTIILDTKLDNFLPCKISVNPFNLQNIHHTTRILLLQVEENISKFL